MAIQCVHKLHLDILNMYMHILKVNFLGQGFQQLKHYRQTHTQTCDQKHHYATFATFMCINDTNTVTI